METIKNNVRDLLERFNSLDSKSQMDFKSKIDFDSYQNTSRGAQNSTSQKESYNDYPKGQQGSTIKDRNGKIGENGEYGQSRDYQNTPHDKINYSKNEKITDHS